jgi:hypothetical protein
MASPRCLPGFAGVSLLVLLTACADEPAVSPADDCGAPAALAPFEQVLASTGSCRDWLDDIRGRVTVNGITGSAVTFSRRTDDGYALVASATHTLGEGWFGPAETTITPAIGEPEQQGVLRLRVPDPDGAAGLDELSTLYSLFHLGIPSDENRDGLRGIKPRNDVFLGLTDRTRVPDPGDGPFPNPPDRTPGLVAIHDPDDHSRADLVFGSLNEGELVALAGYPQDTVTFPQGAFAVGQVLSDAAATDAIATLLAAGDEEGSLPYDPDVEALVIGDALSGMSGGGAFLADGTWVGTLVRASEPHPAFGGLRVVRIVRASYLAVEVAAAFRALDAADQTRLAPFLDAAFE